MREMVRHTLIKVKKIIWINFLTWEQQKEIFKRGKPITETKQLRKKVKGDGQREKYKLK